MEAQAITVEKPFESAEEKFAELVARLSAEESRRLTHSELESVISAEGREVLRRLMQGHLDLRAAGEPRLELVQGADDVKRTHRRLRARGLMTVFGLVTVLRLSYGARRHPSLSPLDAALNLPAQVKDFIARKVVKNDHLKLGMMSFDGRGALRIPGSLVSGRSW
jgi:hypothetical protein